jgi:TrmH family RNA methyltransferase
VSDSQLCFLTPPTVIFVRPQAPGNIGALARAMSNFGATELRLTGAGPTRKSQDNDQSPDPFQVMDWALACRGDNILKNAKWYPDLDGALFDVDLVIGTSGRDVEFEKGYARPFVSPQEAMDFVASWHQEWHQKNKISAESEKFKWALVMGPEDDGLNEIESALCQKLIRIPTSHLNASLNIAMAAGIVLFKYFETRTSPRNTINSHVLSGAFLSPERAHSRLPQSERGRESFATFEQKESFLNYLLSTIGHTQFLKYPDHESVKARIRRWLQIAPIPLGELLFAFEIVYHLKAWGTGKFESRDFLKKQDPSV